MAIGFDKGFELYSQGMLIRSQKAEVIASNIANADTPGYKAKGLDFKDALAKAASNQQTGMSKTHEKHFDVNNEVYGSGGYRVPNQTDTGDGNTVDVQMERNLYLKNSMEYQASVQFLNGKIQAMKKVISGGQ